MNKKIAIIGSINMDNVIEVKAIPAVGETILGNYKFSSPGGKGANQACAAAKLGEEVFMFGAVGKDSDGEKLLESLKESGVDTSFTKIGDHPTGSAFIFINENGNNSIIVSPGANMECDLAYMEEKSDALDKADLWLFQMEIPEETVYSLIKKGFKKGKTIVLDPAPAPDHLPDEILQSIHYLTPNETELQKLTGMPVNTLAQIKEAATFLQKKGVQNLVVTCGEQGSLLVNEKGIQQFPAIRAVAVDTTAAGDSFNGAFAVALANGKSAEEAIIYASHVAAVVVTRMGAQSSLPTKDEVAFFIEEKNA